MKERISETATKVREEAVKKASASGEKDPQKLKQLGDDAERQYFYQVSRESEARLRDFSKSHAEIKKIRDAVRNNDHDDDVVKGIDDWFEFEDSEHLPEIPVQVKSSWAAVNEFKKDKKFRQRKDLLIVLNCGPWMDQEGFDAQLVSEIARVRGILAKRKVHFI